MVVQSCSDEKTVVIVVANLSLPVEGQPKNSFLVRRSREKTLACTRTWSADIPTQDSITNLFLIFYYLCHKYNSFRMHSKRDPIPRSCGTQRRLRQRHNVRKYIIGLVPSTIVHVFKKILMASCLIYLKNKRRRSSAISGHEPSHTALR